MMGANARLNRSYALAMRMELREDAKIVLMSDAHRGDGDRADTFSKNQMIYYAALSQYDREGYTFIELGDGDELWENRKASEIISAHKDVFWMLSKLYQQGRLIMMYGNHDMVKSNSGFIRRSYSYYTDPRTKERIELFGDLTIYEAIILEYQNKEILLIHGHQVDILNSVLWRLARSLVRYIWRPLEAFGINDPTSAAKNFRKKEATERKLIRWVQGKDIMMIAGHTHRPMFPEPGQPRYFNDGSGVHPRCITAIEITDGNIVLVKWAVETRSDGTLFVGKELLEGPKNLDTFFS